MGQGLPDVVQKCLEGWCTDCPERPFCKESVCSTNNLQPCLDSFKSHWNDGWISMTGNIYTENAALFPMQRGGLRVQSGRVTVCVFAWVRPGVMNAQASWLASGAWRSDCVYVFAREGWSIAHSRSVAVRSLFQNGATWILKACWRLWVKHLCWWN